MISLVVAVPYVPGMLQPRTQREVLRQCAGARFIELDATSPTAYARCLMDLWLQRCDLIVCEQDVVPPLGAIRRLQRCVSAWCTHPVDYNGHLREDTLSLVRFAHGLKVWRPDMMRDALLQGGGSYSWPHWKQCDDRVRRHLHSQKVRLHVHQPPAEHLHDWEREASA